MLSPVMNRAPAAIYSSETASFSVLWNSLFGYKCSGRTGEQFESNIGPF